MSDNKKYYYLKLKDNFFDSDEMIVLESMQDGYMYSNILLKLYLRSLKNEGRLMFNERIPFNSNMLASVTRQSVGVVEKAMNIFKELGLIEILDNGAIYMIDIQNFIGQSSTEADRIREYRSRIQDEKNKGVQMLQQKNDKSTPEIELELELETELKLETELEKNTPRNKVPIERVPYQQIMDAYNLLPLSNIIELTDKRKKDLARVYKKYGKDAISTVFNNINNSGFLIGENDRGWKADFDWIFKASNFIKILEGRYLQSNKAKEKVTNNIFLEILMEKGESMDEPFPSNKAIDINQG